MANQVYLSAQDKAKMVKLAATEVDHALARSNPAEYERQMQGVIDTVLNRLASDQFPDTLDAIATQRNQFSAINGPRDRGYPVYGSLDNVPNSVVPKGFSAMVNGWLDQRIAGAPSSVGGNLQYANPNVADRSNLAWINQLDGPEFGAGVRVHQHGTTAGFTPVEAVLSQFSTERPIPQLRPASFGMAYTDPMPNEWPANPPPLPKPPQAQRINYGQSPSGVGIMPSMDGLKRFAGGAPYATKDFGLSTPPAPPPLPRKRPETAPANLVSSSIAAAKDANDADLERALLGWGGSQQKPQIQAAPGRQQRNLGDSLALSPVSGGKQQAPMFDAAYDERLGAMRMLNSPMDTQGMFTASSAAPKAAPTPVTASPQLASRRASDPVLQAALNSKYPTLLPPIPPSSLAITPTGKTIPSASDLARGNSGMSTVASIPTTGVGAPPTTRTVPVAALPPTSVFANPANKGTQPPVVAPNTSPLTASDRARMAQNAPKPALPKPIAPAPITPLPQRTQIAGFSGGGTASPFAPPQSYAGMDRIPAKPPATVVAGQVTPLPNIPGAAGTINPNKPQDRLTADLAGVGGITTPLIPYPAAPNLRPVAPTAPVAPSVPLPRPRPVAAPVTAAAPAQPKIAPIPLPRPNFGMGGPVLNGPVPTQGLAPTPMPRLQRKGLSIGPLQVGGPIGALTTAMANSSGPFNNGGDNLLYNVMRGGDFNTPGAATHKSKSGYLFAPNGQGGFTNVGRALPQVSPELTYLLSNAKNNKPSLEDRITGRSSSSGGGASSISSI